VTEEREEIWITEVAIAEMTEEVEAVGQEEPVVEIEEVEAAGQEEAEDKVEEVADLVVAVEAAVVEELVVAEEEDKLEIKNKITNRKLVTRNFIKCYNRKERNTGKCRKAV
jgi:hypothetical protein